MQPQTKPHYPILDGLRGVAAITVVTFHIFEAHAKSHLTQFINHGYLAVDFFFLLSGFVIAYAYDDRWNKLTVKSFFKRRLIRLQPMVIMGMLIGAACFYFQDCPMWPNIHQVPVWQTLLVMLVGCTLLPLPLSADIRGWQEMHPLDGPAWSLFFEYIGNILYALVVRKFSKAALTLLVIIAGIILLQYAVTSSTGDMTGGWSLNAEQMRIGFTRLMFPFFGGILLFRATKLTHVKNAFAWCSLLLLVVLFIPRIGGAEHFWANGLYEALVIIIIFPLIVYLAASGKLENKFSTRACKFLGDISYPIYITHYAFIYTYTAWVNRHPDVSWQSTLPFSAATLVVSVLVAYLSLKYYDEPIRRWLNPAVKS